MEPQNNKLFLILKLVDIPGLYLYLMTSWVFLIFVIRIYLNPEDSFNNIESLDIFFIPFAITFLMASILNVIDAVTNFWGKFSKGAKWFSMNCYYLLFIIVSSFIISYLKSNNGACLTASIVTLFILSIFVVPLVSFTIAALWKKKNGK
jgi:hypothetical protein